MQYCSSIKDYLSYKFPQMETTISQMERNICKYSFFNLETYDLLLKCNQNFSIFLIDLVFILDIQPF